MLLGEPNFGLSPSSLVFLYKKLTHGETCNLSYSQEISCISWKTMIHYTVFTKAPQRTQFWARLIHFTPSYLISLKF